MIALADRGEKTTHCGTHRSRHPILVIAVEHTILLPMLIRIKELLPRQIRSYLSFLRCHIGLAICSARRLVQATKVLLAAQLGRFAETMDPSKVGRALAVRLAELAWIPRAVHSRDTASVGVVVPV